MKFTHRMSAALTLIIISFMVFSGVAHAEWPGNKPITLIFPYSAGGTGDVIGRLIAKSLQNESAVPIIFENKPGGSASIAESMVARATPDGHTLLITTMSMTMQDSRKLNKNLSYDAKTSFTPIGMAASAPHILVVNSTVPVDNIHGLIDLIKSNPNKFNFGSGGIGTNTHLGGELFKSAAGVDIVHIPYKSSGAVLPDLISGRVQILVSTTATLLPYIQSNQVKPLMVLSDSRQSILPNVPTAREENLSDMAMPNLWVGLAAPAGTPMSIINKLNRDMYSQFNTDEVKSYMAKTGMVLESTTPQQAAEKLNQEVDRWSIFIKTHNINIDE